MVVASDTLLEERELVIRVMCSDCLQPIEAGDRAKIVRDGRGWVFFYHARHAHPIARLYPLDDRRLGL